ncbi:unnamed protein product [Sphagnum troendelagicum]|jgi:hypothetical protein
MTTASGGAVEEESRRKRGGGRGGETNDRPNVRRLVSQAFGGVFGVVFFGKWERTWGGGRERSSGFLGILDEEAEEEGEGFESLRIL